MRLAVARIGLVAGWVLAAASGWAAPRAGAMRDDIPDWWKQTRSIYCPFANSGAGGSLMKFVSPMLRDRLTSFEQLDEILHDARKLGSNVIYLVDTWAPGYEYKGDYVLYPELGGERAFRRGVEKVHAEGGRIILYFEPFIISRRSKLGQGLGRDWAMMNADGTYQSYYQTRDRFYQMYPGPGSGWTDYLVGLIERYARKFHIDGVHLDSYGIQWDWVDHTPKHPEGRNPASFNRGAVELVRRVRQALRKHVPDAVVILEGAEQLELLEACDGAQIESFAILMQKSWAAGRRYPIFTSSFDLAEMKRIVDAGYGLALSPWWLKGRPGQRDRKRLAEKTNARNFTKQLESLSRFVNLLTANGIESLPAGWLDRIRRSILADLNARGWKGAFTNAELQAAVRTCLDLFARYESRLERTPADYLRRLLTRPAGCTAPAGCLPPVPARNPQRP